MCVRSARTDLCGGCRVTGIPTATPDKESRQIYTGQANCLPHHTPQLWLRLCRAVLRATCCPPRAVQYHHRTATVRERVCTPTNDSAREPEKFPYSTATVTGALVWEATVITSGASADAAIPDGTTALT